MKQITEAYAKLNNLNIVGSITDTDMSKIILKMERLKEDKRIKYARLSDNSYLKVFFASEDIPEK